MSADYLKNLIAMATSLDNLRSSMYEVSGSWHDDADVENVLDKVSGFPFETSFDEMTDQVVDWIYRAMIEIKREFLVHSILASINEAGRTLNETSSFGMLMVEHEDIIQAMQDAYEELTRG